MSKQKTPKEVEKAIACGNINHRILHKNCSEGKDKAMIITRRFDKWIYYCFRCKMYGEVSFKKNTPALTLNLAERIQKRAYTKKHGEMHLPSDYVPLTHDTGTTSARNWLWKYGIGLETWEKYKIGWSDAYQRVIIPIFSGHSLQGWVARDVEFIPESEKTLYKVPKYLLKTKDKSNREYFVCDDFKAKTVVLVEDVLSAIKVKMCASKDVATVALLNSDIDVDFIFKRFKDYSIKVWLDQDMRRKSIQKVVKLASLGFTARHIFSFDDPKVYGADKIDMFLSGIKK